MYLNLTRRRCIYAILSDKNECDLYPCQNNATCENNDGSYSCNCLAGWTGQDCEIGQFSSLIC